MTAPSKDPLVVGSTVKHSTPRGKIVITEHSLRGSIGGIGGANVVVVVTTGPVVVVVITGQSGQFPLFIT